jgi:hypothetical protein
LLTESQVFEDEVFPGTTSADHPAQEMPEKHDHDKHFIGAVRIEPVAMSFILRVYEVLASHSDRKVLDRFEPRDYAEFEMCPLQQRGRAAMLLKLHIAPFKETKCICNIDLLIISMHNVSY